MFFSASNDEGFFRLYFLCQILSFMTGDAMETDCKLMNWDWTHRCYIIKSWIRRFSLGQFIFVKLWYFNLWRPLINYFDLKQILGSDSRSSLIWIKILTPSTLRRVPLKCNYSFWQIKLLKIFILKCLCFEVI